MQVKEYLLVFLCLIEHSLAFKSCSKQHDRKSICFTNETGYLMPYPVSLDVEITLKDIIRIDQDLNSISVRLELFTNWIDNGLGLSDEKE